MEEWQPSQAEAWGSKEEPSGPAEVPNQWRPPLLPLECPRESSAGELRMAQEGA